MKIKSFPWTIFHLSLALLIGIGSSSIAQTVYITKTGAKYHTQNCRYLKYSSISIELKKALELGKTACSVCKPVRTQSKTKNSETVTETPKNLVQSKRCSAITQAGAQCKRFTEDSSGKCWQHKGEPPS